MDLRGHKLSDIFSMKREEAGESSSEINFFKEKSQIGQMWTLGGYDRDEMLRPVLTVVIIVILCRYHSTVARTLTDCLIVISY